MLALEKQAMKKLDIVKHYFLKIRNLGSFNLFFD